MNEIELNEIWKMISSADDAIFQNNSKTLVEIYVGDTAPTLKQRGLQLYPGIAIQRSEIPSIGDVYGRSKGNGTIIVAE